MGRYFKPEAIREHGISVQGGRGWLEPNEFNRLSVQDDEVLVTIVSNPVRALALQTSGRAGEYDMVFKSYADGNYLEIDTYRVAKSKLPACE